MDESIKASLQEADRMKHLIQEMLDLTRAEQIDVQYPYEITNVNEVVRRVVSDLAMVHPDFKIQLDEDDLPDDTEIQMYHGHLEQLLVILIDNGIKYSTDRKQINVSAGVTKKKSASWCKTSVKVFHQKIKRRSLIASIEWTRPEPVKKAVMV